jgi:hypothetical protein
LSLFFFLSKMPNLNSYRLIFIQWRKKCMCSRKLETNRKKAQRNPSFFFFFFFKLTFVQTFWETKKNDTTCSCNVQIQLILQIHSSSPSSHPLLLLFTSPHLQHQTPSKSSSFSPFPIHASFPLSHFMLQQQIRYHSTINFCINLNCH